MILATADDEEVLGSKAEVVDEAEEEKSQKITQKKELWGGKEGEYW